MLNLRPGPYEAMIPRTLVGPAPFPPRLPCLRLRQPNRAVHLAILRIHENEQAIGIHEPEERAIRGIPLGTLSEKWLVLVALCWRLKASEFLACTCVEPAHDESIGPRLRIQDAPAVAAETTSITVQP